MQGRHPSDSRQTGIVLCLQAFLCQAFKAAFFSSAENSLSGNSEPLQSTLLCPNATCSTNTKRILSSAALGLSFHSLSVPGSVLQCLVPQSVLSVTSYFIYEVLCVGRSLWTVARCVAFFSSPVFVVSLNPANLCLNLLMAITDPTPNNLLGENGVTSPLQEVSPEEVLPWKPLGCLGSPAPTQAVPTQENSEKPWEATAISWL